MHRAADIRIGARQNEKKERKLQWFGHLKRRPGTLTHTVMYDRVEGRQGGRKAGWKEGRVEGRQGRRKAGSKEGRVENDRGET